MSDYVIAKYLRLSLDDAATDSMSIENQRLILDKHIAELGIDCTEILEFVDNGYSGTSFERPGIQAMLELVRTGGVRCICVKDFSRFGRDAIEAGYLLERVFPLYGVRFISVSDGFDSAEHEGGTGGIEVAFKLLIHEFYSKDLSRKIKAAAHERMRRGERVSKNGVFGYRLDKQRNMVADDPAAETVRRIFNLALAGSSVTEIAKCLYEEKRPTPGEYRARVQNPSCIWSDSSIRQILANEQYVGTYIAGKTEITEVGSKPAVAIPESEWIRIPKHHEPIMSQANFDTVRAIFVKKHTSSGSKTKIAKWYETQTSPLKGKVICGCCSHVMQLSMSKNARFNCKFTRHAADTECHGLSVTAAELEQAVYTMIIEQAQSVFGTYDITKSGIEQPKKERELDRLGNEKRRLYEQLMLDEIDRDSYASTNAAVDAELDRVKNMSYFEQNAGRGSAAKLRELVGETMTSGKLTTPLVDAFIERIRVFPENRLEVEWAVADWGATDAK